MALKTFVCCDHPGCSNRYQQYGPNKPRGWIRRESTALGAWSGQRVAIWSDLCPKHAKEN